MAKITEAMTAVIPAPREKISDFAPRIETLQIDPDKIGKLIGDDVRILVFSAYVEALADGGADRGEDECESRRPGLPGCCRHCFPQIVGSA